MRPIDADTIEKWIADRVKNYHKSFPDWRKTHPISVETALLELDCIKDVVRESPTIDAVPVDHARWEYNPGDNIPYCSGCAMPQDAPTNYCPCCGAKMDGGESDG